MQTKRIIKKFNFSKQDAINVVLDIDNYKDFLPWCKNSIIKNKIKGANKDIIFADLQIGYKLFFDTYTSKVIFDKKKTEIIVTPEGGPIKKLYNIWKFKELTKKTCEIDFYIEIELSNFVLNKIFENFFDIGFKKIFNSFENRVKKINP